MPLSGSTEVLLMLAGDCLKFLKPRLMQVDFCVVKYFASRGYTHLGIRSLADYSRKFVISMYNYRYHMFNAVKNVHLFACNYVYYRKGIS